MAASKPLEQTATVNCDFPGSAQWVSLVDAKDDVPSFNIQNIVSYFIERKANDNESNKDFKNVSRKAFGLFRHGHIQKLPPYRVETNEIPPFVTIPTKAFRVLLFLYEENVTC